MSDKIDGFHVAVFRHGKTQWLHSDESSFTHDFYESASFNTPKLAEDIAKREVGKFGEVTWCVMASMERNA